ncbi:adherens junction-associated protein 1 [Colossoma macropomum]|uniref:adherens junction-associated protein 1 n=1 Tax=Colossoma macropomum TaxID=42526 RepID=UPI001864F50B|nr:adherens junction-associated protein 1 [Colossoma macropomum]
MWIKRCIARSSMAALKPSGLLGCRMWILFALVHLTMDLSLCAPVGQGLPLKLLPRSAPRMRPRPPPTRDAPSAQHWRTLGSWQRSVPPPPVPSPGYRGGAGLWGLGSKSRSQRQRRQLCEGCSSKSRPSEGGESLEFLEGSKADILRHLLRSRRQLKWDSYDNSQEGRTTTVAGFIDWGPTGTDEGVDDEVKVIPNTTATTKASTTTTTTTITTTTTRSPQRTYAVVTTPHPRRLSTTQPTINLGVTVKPQKPFGDTPGLAVHQIITITVSLIMVIAALITTLVLKNCCAQSGNGRHTSHQRKINQQEESCQNLTDFTPARVPSKVDIFTAYNDSLQCSHECVRTAVPVYTDEMIQHTPIYKTTYNGNRPSPTERQLIPVAFVSEKWFEISC